MLNYLGLPVQASTHAADIDQMISLVHWLMLVLFVGWGAYFVFVLFRFRAGANPKASYVGAKGKISKGTEVAVAIIEVLLLVFYGFSPATMVGTDIVHAVLLAALTSVLQYRLGNVDFALVFAVLLGSVPGGILGAHLTNKVPSARLKQVLCALLTIVGARMLWMAIVHAN